MLPFLDQDLLGQQVPKGMVFVPGNTKIEPFYIDKYEVTISEFYAFVKATGYVTEAEKLGGTQYTAPGGVWKLTEGDTWRSNAALKKLKLEKDMASDPQFAKHPVMGLAPADIIAYAKWIGKRVPTYWEWVHAAKAAQENYPYKYPGSKNLKEIAWFEITSNQYFPEEVGTKKPNELGIYDLAGNASELVSDDALNPTEFRIVGGSLATPAESCQIGKMENIPVVLSRPLCCLGIRLVKDLK